MKAKYTPQFLPAEAPVEPIRLLDENGQLANGTKPPMDEKATRKGLRMMMLARAFDTKCFSLQRQGRLGTFAPMVGQEASTLGPAMALDPKRDWIAPQYRELPALLQHGLHLERVALYRRGHLLGAYIPDGVNMVVHQISLAAQIPHAVGLAWGLKLQNKDSVVIAFFGDGASSEGDFHEACNLAGVIKAPIIFLLQNNGWAISTPRAIQSAATDLASRAPGYGFPGVVVDGNDLFATHAVTAEAVARARAGEGPTLIETMTYRMWAHTTSDDPTRYVEPEELELWQKRDPIDRVQKYLAAAGKWDAATATKWDEELTAEVDAAFEKAESYPPVTAADLFDHVYAERTPTLERQRAERLAYEQEPSP